MFGSFNGNIDNYFTNTRLSKSDPVLLQHMSNLPAAISADISNVLYIILLPSALAAST